jgi:hypothetical protein
VAYGTRLLDEWIGEQMTDAWRGDPFWGVIAEGGPFHANVLSPEWRDYVQRLRDTGRAHHAEKLARFGGRPFNSGLER